MLVLSRKPNESIQIGNDVVLTVLQVQGNRVRLGIEAPAKVVIRRAELPCLAESPKTTPTVSLAEPNDPPTERAIA
jgi:carbon storage regulator